LTTTTSLDQFLAVSEKAFQQTVIDYAHLLGYLVYHTYDSRRSAFGFPDLVILGRREHGKPSRCIFAELKSEKGKTSPAQEAWLMELRACPGVECYVWRPRDWQEIVRVLE